MKKLYRVSNVFALDELLSAVNDHGDVNPIPVVDGEFLNVDTMEEKYIKRPKHIQANHIFEVSEADPNSMFLYEYDGEEPHKQVLVRPNYKEMDWTDEAITLMTPKPAVGIQDIKWMELYDKWRPLIPLERQTYKYIKEPPSTEIRSKVKKHTGEAKKQRQERSRTETAATQTKAEADEEAFGGEQPTVSKEANQPGKI
jgi:hypothetical protein